MEEFKTASWEEIVKQIKDNPDSNFVVFTHRNRSGWSRFWSAGTYIRRVLSLKYKLPMKFTPSHTGNMWYDEVDEEIYYWHQTYPTFKKEIFTGREFMLFFQVDNPYEVAYARKKCKELLRKERGYAIGTLLTFAFTIWFTWFSNPITIGKVCSEAVAAMYPTIIKGNASDVDPVKALSDLSKKMNGVVVWKPK